MRRLFRKTPTPAEIIGPRTPGSVYLDGTRNVKCEVLAIDGVWVADRDLDGPRPGDARWHCYPWDPSKDRLITAGDGRPNSVELAR